MAGCSLVIAFIASFIRPFTTIWSWIGIVTYVTTITIGHAGLPLRFVTNTELMLNT